VRVSRIAAAVRAAFCAGILLAVWPAGLAAEDEPTAMAVLPVKQARWPSLRSGPLQDNSFLIEEAYNQEPGVVQHINSVLYDRTSGGWLANFTQEWPLGGQRHQLSYSVPFSWLGEGGRGPGDVLLNYRYQLSTEQGRRPAVAPRLSLIFPSGDFRQGLETGSAGIQANLPVSKQLSERLAAHFNLGTTILPRVRGGDLARRQQLSLWNAGGSLIWLPARGVNFLGELVAFREGEVGAPDSGAHGASYRNRAIFSPGIRVGRNCAGGVQAVWGIAFPVELAGNRGATGVFLYFSIEHGFTRKAREERHWQ
jgi:hypothetical protein